MRDPSPFLEAVPWPLLALLSYLASVTLGLISLRRRPGRSWHRRLFITTCAVTALAALLALSVRWESGLLLVLALVPLAVLPYAGSAMRRPGRHAAIGLAAAPCYLAALALWIARP